MHISQSKSSIGLLISSLLLVFGTTACTKRDVVDRIRGGDAIQKVHVMGFTTNEIPFAVTIKESNAVQHLSQQITHAKNGVVERGKSYTAEITLTSGFRQQILMYVEKGGSRLMISYGDHDAGPSSLLLVTIDANAPAYLTNSLAFLASN